MQIQGIELGDYDVNNVVTERAKVDVAIGSEKNLG